ncbi:unnamed protein product [Closterium sp. NIES-65]|nr:unnamed protein product [Closterium sp. NIES-65]
MDPPLLTSPLLLPFWLAVPSLPSPPCRPLLAVPSLPSPPCRPLLAVPSLPSPPCRPLLAVPSLPSPPCRPLLAVPSLPSPPCPAPPGQRFISPAYRFNDDGEPGGTAGRPILAAIEGAGVDGVMVVVTR